jgi:nitrogen regulatory protein PII
MKLLIITSIIEFKDEVKKILKKSQVTSYSFKEVIGYWDNQDESIQENWFASEMNENDSIMFHVFIPKNSVDIISELINEFNNKQETASQIHIATINLENN